MYKNIKRTKYISLSLILFIVLLSSCSVTINKTKINTKNDINTKINNDKMSILVTNDLIKNIINKIDNSNYIVDSMVHDINLIDDYKPDYYMIKQGKFNSFYYIGAGLEPFLSKVLENMDRNKIQIVNLSRGIDVLRMKNNLDEKTEIDNFYYLNSLNNYKIVLFNTKNSLQEMNPKLAKIYEEKFAKVINQIDDDFKEKNSVIDKLKKYEIAIENDKLNYFCQDFDIKSISLEDKINEIDSLENAKNRNSSIQISQDANNETEKNNIKIFFYINDSSIKEKESILKKYNFRPVKIELFTKNKDSYESIKNNYEKVRDFLDLNDK